MGTDYVYFATTGPLYTYSQAVDFCVTNHNGDLPMISSQLDIRNLFMDLEITLNGMV